MAIYADPERGRYPVWQSLDHENFLPGSGIIFVTVTGDFSERIESLPDGQVKEEVIQVLRSMYPNVTIPDPLDFAFPRWYSDPLYRGSYSNWPASFVSQHHENLRANVDKLYFAGEGTSKKYFGFLHGAYFEGLEVTKEMIKCIKHHGCVGLKHVDQVKNTASYGV
ncbi:Polyamine oxidase [Hypsizygus marmoreus]|uniref:Polyamine oxidase n=1 Tax=Hypsizygus marmoreus TaxID=39966 RepID=A0A369JLF6_HYPMA|nr:Polyamine oxidase [Hypsizygus marmoreus]